LSLDRAYHLVTEAVPRIYWRPYILRQEQRDKIDEQVSQAKAEIDASEQGTTLLRRDSPETEDKEEQEKSDQLPEEGKGNGGDSTDPGAESPVSVTGNGVSEE
jgi:hypothetical protein